MDVRQMKGDGKEWRRGQEGGGMSRKRIFLRYRCQDNFLYGIGEGHVIFCITKFLIVSFASDNGMGKSK